MNQPRKVALVVFSVLLGIAFLVTLQATRRRNFVGDPYEAEIGRHRHAYRPPAHTEPCVQWQEGPEASQESTEEAVCDNGESQEVEHQEAEPEEPPAPELNLPEAQVYTDSTVPSFAAGSDVVMGTPIVRGTKSLIPLYPSTEKACADASFLTLAEAVEQKKTRIVDSGSVDTVYVVNDSDQPIFLMCGEIIFGGKQDRVIAQDTVVPAERGKKFRVGVFCVERSRWRTKETGYAFTCKPETYKKDNYGGDTGPDPGRNLPSLAQAIEEMKRQEAFANLAGRGIAYACILSDCGEGGQDEVWSRVSKANKKLGTENATNAYRNNLASSEVHRRLSADLDAFLKGTEDDDRAIGYAFALNGTVLYSDIFATPELCRAFRYRLIKAYLIDTLGEGCNPRFTPTAANFANFLKWVESNRLQEKARPGFAYYKSEYLIGCDSTYEGRRLHSGYYYDGFSEK